MKDNMSKFGETAKSLTRNPLGIIALFIVLVYGLASLVTAFAGSLTSAERIPLIYFLVFFPVLVLGVFSWLVAKHPGKLFAPSDFKDENNYLKIVQMAAIVSSIVATTKTDTPESEEARSILSSMISGYARQIQESDTDAEKNRIREELVSKINYIAEREEMPSAVFSVYVEHMLATGSWLTLPEFIVSLQDPQVINSWSEEVGQAIVDWLFKAMMKHVPKEGAKHGVTTPSSCRDKLGALGFP